MDNILSGFHQFSLQQPHALALHAAGRDHSYGELRAYVTKIAGWLLKQKKDEVLRVGVLGSRSVEAYTAVLAACWLGATYVPLNPKLPVLRLMEMIQDAKIHCLIVDANGSANLSDLKDTLTGTPILALHGEQGSTNSSVAIHSILSGVAPINEPLPVAANDFVYLMHTSGTTGKPKGIAVTAENLAHYLHAMQQRYLIIPSDRLSQLFELSFDASVFDLFMTWNHGASLHTVPAAQVMAPGNFIRERCLTLWFGVPSTIAFLQKMKMLRANSFPTLRISLFGGEPLPVASVAAWHDAAPASVIDNFYGPTETTVICFVQNCRPPYLVTPGSDVIAIGKPYERVFAGIINEQREFLSANQSGQIVIGGIQVTPGYWQDEKLSRQKFLSLTHPRWGTQRWYLTGDLGYQDQAGVFHYQGRIDNQVKVTGHRIELEEVEVHLREAARTVSVAVVAWPIVDDAALGLIGFVSGTDERPDAIKKALGQRLPLYMLPKRIIVVPSLPYTVNGKVNRKELVAWLGQEAKPDMKN